ncbi:MAG: glucose-1-phosphate adenylyltransferase [Oscillospiraceae bacterium]|nr:glucose-1-phosphate adenylyltransferase [Oscillospiraceae bacterium]
MNFKKKDCVAMILAGGQGTRLYVLTENTAKPAVPFGGKYRLIDFPLSNCVNSGIDTVGILTQYQPLQLNEYIGNGSPWGLNSANGGVHILSPYSRSEGSDWYKGTANAIFQNISFIDRYNPTHVLILSGDHVYKMDYAAMLADHKKNEADCTIAVLNVPIEEASRFGIMNTEADGKIYEFEEKPKVPKSTKASMGVYIFRWDILREYLVADDADPTSSNDFGKNIIPKLLADEHRLYAYEFDGYWKDVGTIDSLWQANMEILGENPELDMRDPDSCIYARNYAHPSSYIAPDAEIVNSYVAEGCSVYGKVRNSVISTGCVIEKEAEVCESFVMPDAVIETHAAIRYAIIGENATVHANARVGDNPQFYEADKWGIAVVGKDKVVEQNKMILPKEVY